MEKTKDVHKDKTYFNLRRLNCIFILCLFVIFSLMFIMIHNPLGLNIKKQEKSKPPMFNAFFSKLFKIINNTELHELNKTNGTTIFTTAPSSETLSTFHKTIQTSNFTTAPSSETLSTFHKTIQTSNFTTAPYSETLLTSHKTIPTSFTIPDMTFLKEYKMNITDDIYCKINKELNQLYKKLMRQNSKFIIFQELKTVINMFSCNKTEYKKEVINKDIIFDVCPEKYKDTYYGMESGFKVGFVTEDCKSKPFAEVLTILLDVVHSSSHFRNNTAYILEEIRKEHPNINIQISLEEKHLSLFKSHDKNVKINVFSYSNSLGFILNKMLKNVSTPYVYILRDITEYTYHSNLKRLVRVLSEKPDVSVVGGAYRNLDGIWSANCFQSTLSNYYIRYEAGYFHSSDCMQCDYVLGPLAIKVSHVINILFDETLSSKIIYEDLFYRIRHLGYLVMSCVDVMNFMEDTNMPTDFKAWLDFAKKYEINKVIFPNETSLEISCKDLNEKCNALKITGYFTLPLCCQNNVINSLDIITNYFEQMNITYFLFEGTLLGAIKFGGPIPWDIDMDIIYPQKDKNFLKSKSTEQFWEKHGFSIIYSGVDKFLGKFVDLRTRLYYNSQYIELFSMSNVINFTDIKFINRPTIVKFDRLYLKAPINPGLVLRNQFGHDYLKHSRSWFFLGKGMWTDYPETPFPPCSKPNHHACLDNFPNDGNMEFQIP